MNECTRTLLAGIIDYAGLFPPAALDMQTAVSKYLDALRPRELSSWMVEKFVCPTNRLNEFAGYAFAEPRDEPLAIAALCPKADSAPDWPGRFVADVASIREFVHAHHERAFIASIELAPPADCFMNRAAMQAMAEHLQAVLHDGAELHGLHALYVEIPSASSNAALLSEIADVLQPLQRDQPPSDPGERMALNWGLKLRTGGLEAAAFPSPARFVEFLRACHSRGLSWKATAGLHHPFSHFDSAIGVLMYGFLNVAAADALMYAMAELPDAEFIELLEDGNDVHFAISQNSLRWKSHRVMLDEVADARWSSFQCFGSCSYDEPIDGLRKFGLL